MCYAWPQRWAIVDIGLRMLSPRELARAQGFGDDYQLTGTRSEQIARIGNSVCPPVVDALVRSLFADDLVGIWDRRPAHRARTRVTHARGHEVGRQDSVVTPSFGQEELQA